MKQFIVVFLFVFIFVLTGCSNNETQQLASTQKVVEKEVTEGDFIYRLVTEKTEYVENEPVNIYAELEYIGPKDEIEIFHAASPFSFPIVEKTRGFEIDYVMEQPLLRTTLIKGEPLRKDYMGSGGYGSEDEKEYVEFIKRVMKKKFPTGQYVVNGMADFFVITNEKTDEKKEYQIKSTIHFKVKEKK